MKNATIKTKAKLMIISRIAWRFCRAIQSSNQRASFRRRGQDGSEGTERHSVRREDRSDDTTIELN